MASTMKNNEILLSIITICYNQSDIEETCESIVAQTFQNFEWIVVDGGSTDGTLQKLEKYKNRINIFISEKDRGRYHAMNKGIRLAKGKYLNFMNGGDSYFEKNSLEKTMNILQCCTKAKSGPDVLYGGTNLIFSNNDRVVDPAPQLSRKFFIANNINHQSSFIKKSLFEKYGYYNEQIKIFGDYESWLLFWKNRCKFKHMDLIVVNFKKDGISADWKDKQYIMERANIIRKYFLTEEINDFYSSRLKFLEKIFSIKKELDYKVVRILGLKIKYKYTGIT
ncbi:MAG: glycosyltransferase [Holosporaceae bacterium]|jgi:glycosyltransferase involved in cell wall biosynthesis|nr:glycosyltransferase [Holosporaceae bacterium]